MKSKNFSYCIIHKRCIWKMDYLVLCIDIDLPFSHVFFSVLPCPSHPIAVDNLEEEEIVAVKDSLKTDDDDNNIMMTIVTKMTRREEEKMIDNRK